MRSTAVTLKPGPPCRSIMQLSTPHPAPTSTADDTVYGEDEAWGEGGRKQRAQGVVSERGKGVTETLGNSNSRACDGHHEPKGKLSVWIWGPRAVMTAGPGKRTVVEHPGPEPGVERFVVGADPAAVRCGKVAPGPASNRGERMDMRKVREGGGHSTFNVKRECVPRLGPK